MPAGGYPESRAFDELYTSVLNLLQAAWEQGSQAQLGQAIGAMFKLAAPARELMQKPRPDGKGNFGPSFLLIPNSTGGPMTNIRYADIQDYLTAIMNVEIEPISESPHGVWWNISYEAFTTGNVPGVTNFATGAAVPIMDTQHPLQSAFYVILTDSDGLSNVGPQMPQGGPFITDSGYKTKLASGKEITGAEIMANIKSWLENKFPK